MCVSWETHMKHRSESTMTWNNILVVMEKIATPFLSNYHYLTSPQWTCIEDIRSHFLSKHIEKGNRERWITRYFVRLNSTVVVRNLTSIKSFNYCDNLLHHHHIYNNNAKWFETPQVLILVRWRNKWPLRAGELPLRNPESPRLVNKNHHHSCPYPHVWILDVWCDTHHKGWGSTAIVCGHEKHIHLYS